MWLQLKNGKFKGLDFDRQKIIGNYIVDFYCANKKLVIEIDGSSHNEKAEYDIERENFLKELGLTIIHLLDIDIKKNMQNVLDYLDKII